MAKQYDFDPSNGCPVCGIINEFHKSHDPERLEPDTEHCEFCGYFWEENAAHGQPTDGEIDDYRDGMMERYEWWKQHGEMIAENIRKLKKL